MTISRLTPDQHEWPIQIRPGLSRAEPSELWVEGHASGNHPTLAVIGTRQCDTEMFELALKVATAALNAIPELWIISGLALGCDTAAHQAALTAGRQTCAVLAGGAGRIYPSNNRQLARNISSTGGLIWHHPAEHDLNRHAFVERDYVQAGMSRGLLLIATGISGGSWHATREAARLGRPVSWLEAPGHGEHWEGNRALSRCLSSAKSGSLKPLARLLRITPEKLDLRQFTEIRGRNTLKSFMSTLNDRA